MKTKSLWVVAVLLAGAPGCTSEQLAGLRRAIGVALPSALPMANPSATKAGIITTVAGTGVKGETGDGGPAVKAKISGPQGLAFNLQDGSLYFINYGDRWIRIRRVAPTGIISSIPHGDYENGYPFSGTIPYWPNCLNFDPWGNLYACASNVVMKQEPTGKWTIIAGGEYNTVYRGPRQGGVSDAVFPASPPPDPLPGEEGRAIGDGRLATDAALNYPSDLVFDGVGNLYVSDSGYERVRKIDRNGIISTFAGSGILNPFSPMPQIWYGGDGGPATSAFLNGPSGLAVDSMNNLYVADCSNHRIRKIEPNGTISTFAGSGEEMFGGDGGQAAAAGLNYPTDVAVDPFGNVFIADSGNHRIRRVDAKGIITTVAGTGTPNRDPEGHLIGDNGASDGGPALAARLANPSDIAVDNQGSVYVAEEYGDRIRKISFQ